MRRLDKVTRGNSMSDISSGTANDRSDVKENNGKGAKNRLCRNVLILIISCVAVVSIIRSTIGNTSSPRASSREYSRDAYDKYGMEDFRKIKKKEKLYSDRMMMGRQEQPDMMRRQQRQRPDMMMPREGMDGGMNNPGMKNPRWMGFGDLFGAGAQRTPYHRETLPEYAREMTEEELVLSATVDMGSIQAPRGNIPYGSGGSRSYRDVKGVFCKIDWELHKTNPAKIPMSRDLIGKSEDCRYSFSMDLATIVEKARAYDAAHPEQVRAIAPTGFVFHESRCGSTLVANSLAVSIPEEHRVWSESRPPIEVMMHCKDTENFSDCDKEQVIQLLRDVIYMMGRTRDPKEKRLFFKIQSVGAQHMRILLDAFPDTPWVFVYRDPVQVMMSHLDIKVKYRANCMRHSNSPHISVRKVLDEFGLSEFTTSVEEYCAVHLASLCETALSLYNDYPKGMLVNYNTLPNALIDTIYPNHFNIPIDPVAKQNILAESGHYSKQKNPRKGVIFEGDNEKKEKRATQEILDASQTLLSPVYDKLESLALAGVTD